MFRTYLTLLSLLAVDSDFSATEVAMLAAAEVAVLAAAEVAKYI